MALGTKINTKGNYHWFLYPVNHFADYKAPTVTELNTGFVNAAASNAISYNDTDFGVQASETNDDPSFAARGLSLTRGAAQYGGSLSFYYPAEADDPNNSLSRFYDMLTQRSEWYVVVRNDGIRDWDDNWEAGDLFSIFRIIVGGESQAITGTEAFRYTITGLPRGEMKVYGVVAEAGGSVTVDIPTVAPTPTVGDKGTLKATVTGGLKTRQYTHGVKWTSSDPTVLEVTRNGVYIARAAGTATITATYEATGDDDTLGPITVA